jgi:oxygen-independent coproporphyrinogen III oxidase
MTTSPRHVYVHVPFCARRCSYCDFSIAVRKDVPVSEFLQALRGEIRRRLGTTDTPHEIDTLYFGGGTPSHLGPKGVAGMMTMMREFFRWEGHAEITLEANPDDVTPSTTARWLQSGITRVSLGAQSFDPHVLEWMHRTHGPAQIDTAVEVLRDTPFTSWSFDLIFALPDVLQRDWARDLERALGKQPPHLSLYGLTVEQGTPLGRWAERGEVQPGDDAAYEQEFLSAHEAAVAAGFEHYEVSNFAQPGHQSKHNRSYWRGVPYFGFGPSAHGFDGTTRRWNLAAYAAWHRAISSGLDPVGGSELIDDEAKQLESVYLGLRTTRGLELGPEERRQVEPWITAGWATLFGNHLTLTPLGWLRLDSLASTLTPVRTVR